MKELSIEDKAKAYDEILVKAMELKEANPADEGIQRWVDDTFPELKESEDEKIRKELLNAFQEAEDSLYMVLSPHRRESFIAWLEKQVEQKPTWSEEDEKVIHCLEYTVRHFYEDEDTIKWCCDWLKSLKPQSQWKPSDRQMVAINTAINVLGKGTLNGKELIKLQKQLKKLREE